MGIKDRDIEELLNDILNMEGIIIRKIPQFTVSTYSYIEQNMVLLKNPKAEVFFSEKYKRDMIRITEKNTQGGKFIITFAMNQMSQVRFDIKKCGLGETIIDAYNNYLYKNGLAV